MIPVVRGIVMTDERGPEPIAVLGSPGDSLNGKDMRLYYPYPNPFHGRCSIRFDLLKNIHATMWIVSAKPETKAVFKPTVQDTIKILVNGTFKAGTKMRVIWDCKTDKSVEVQNGFYRIYLQSDSELLWTDGLALDPSKPIPSDVDSFLNSIGFKIQ
jgi:hypothetical protein